MISHNGVNLDPKSQLVLQALNETDSGTLNTTDARTVTAINDNNKVRYRFKKLEKAGLVTLSKDEGADQPGIPPTVAELTPEGEEKAEEWNFSAGEDQRTIYDQLDQLSSQLDHMGERLDGIDSRLQQVEEGLDPEGDDPDMETIREGFIAIRNYLQQEHEADLLRYTDQ